MMYDECFLEREHDSMERSYLSWREEPYRECAVWGCSENATEFVDGRWYCPEHAEEYAPYEEDTQEAAPA